MFHSVVQLMVHSCHISLKKTQFGPLGLIFFTDWLNSMCNSDEKLPNFVKNIRVWSSWIAFLPSGLTSSPQWTKKNSSLAKLDWFFFYRVVELIVHNGRQFVVTWAGGGGVEGRGHFRGEIEGDVVRCGRGGVSLAAPKATPRLIIRSFIHSFIFFFPFYTHTHTHTHNGVARRHPCVAAPVIKSESSECK